jgi:hypothetical protein
VKRIAVIGAGGAGKTRLARALGQVLDLPAGLRPKLDRRFLAYVLTFRRRRPALLAELARRGPGVALVTLSSRRAVRRFLKDAGAPARRPGRPGTGRRR